MKKIFLMFVVMFLSISFVFAQESITITTYYPSPYGSYNELRANRLAVGSNYQTVTIPENSLLVEDMVGIGRTTIGIYDGQQTRLDVEGFAAVSDIYLKNPKSGNPRWASESETHSQSNYFWTARVACQVLLG